MTDRNEPASSSEAGNMILFLGVVIAFGLIAFGAYSVLSKKTVEVTEPIVEEVKLPIDNVVATTTPINASTTPAGLTISNLKEGDTVKMPIEIKGTVNGAGWVAFEAQMGTVVMLDEAGKKIAGPVILTAVDEWMKLPADFSGKIGDEKLAKTMADKKITLLFTAENPSGTSTTATFKINLTVTK